MPCISIFTYVFVCLFTTLPDYYLWQQTGSSPWQEEAVIAWHYQNSVK
jgi:hypothetical protein